MTNENGFHTLGLPDFMLQALERLSFLQPTPIQEKVIPLALEGKDILGSAQTGTGKTGAFGIPLIVHLMKDNRNAALVMAPTRELAMQVMDMLRNLLGKKQQVIKTALLIGGDSIFKQFQQLKANPSLIVATPGRLIDILDRIQRDRRNEKGFDIQRVNFLVLDETDCMLNLGFKEQIDEIIEMMKPKEERQTLLFSATLPDGIIKLAHQYLQQPERVSMTPDSSYVENLIQEVIRLSESEKYQRLIEQLEKRQGSVIVFVKTRDSAEKMAIRLRQDHHQADAIHGDLSQRYRAKTMRDFRDSRFRIMVATDVAARGLDVPHVEHVINYDLPQCPEDYTHRIGRTARAGKKGSALCFVTPADQSKWRLIHRLINPEEAREEEKRLGHRRSFRDGNSRFSGGRGSFRPSGSGAGGRFGSGGQDRFSRFRSREDESGVSRDRSYHQNRVRDHAHDRSDASTSDRLNDRFKKSYDRPFKNRQTSDFSSRNRRKDIERDDRY